MAFCKIKVSCSVWFAHLITHTQCQNSQRMNMLRNIKCIAHIFIRWNRHLIYNILRNAIANLHPAITDPKIFSHQLHICHCYRSIFHPSIRFLLIAGHNNSAISILE